MNGKPRSAFRRVARNRPRSSGGHWMMSQERLLPILLFLFHSVMLDGGTDHGTEKTRLGHRCKY